MRIITGATERCHVQSLYDDLGWYTLSQRRLIHRLTWMYKIKRNIAPSYLVDVLPSTTRERHHYPLRRVDDITPCRANRELFSKSFFPATVREWNVLLQSIRQSCTLMSFRNALKLHYIRPKKIPWYGTGDRSLDVHHSRLRIGCSKLKHHLFYNLHVEDSPSCTCGFNDEHPKHYFFNCTNYTHQRHTLITNIMPLAQPTLELLLFGSAELTVENNIYIAHQVQQYMKDTGRFV